MWALMRLWVWMILCFSASLLTPTATPARKEDELVISPSTPPLLHTHTIQHVQAQLRHPLPLRRRRLGLRHPSRTRRQQGRLRANRLRQLRHQPQRRGHVLGGRVPTIQGPRTIHVQDAIRSARNHLPRPSRNLRVLLRTVRHPAAGARRHRLRSLGQVVLRPRILHGTTGMGHPRRRLDPAQERNVNSLLLQHRSCIMVLYNTRTTIIRMCFMQPWREYDYVRTAIHNFAGYRTSAPHSMSC